MEDLTAWKGELEFLGASWNDRDGRMVAFRIVETANSRVVEHPFKHFTRKRGGRIGTRFTINYAKPGSTEASSCEVMLLDWSENAGGRSVKFWVDPDPDRHPFEGLRRPSGSDVGDTLMVAMVEMDDDEQPVHQGGVDEEGRPVRKQRLSNVAALFCREPAFQAFCKSHVKLKVGVDVEAVQWDEGMCAHWIRHVCEIESRRYLDTDPVAQMRFHELVRKPYQAYRGHHYDPRMQL